MIEKHFGDFVLRCDICDEIGAEDFDTFQDAVDSKKRLGWKSEKHSKGWRDICPECQNG